MKLFCNNIVSFIKYGIFFTVLFGVLLQPVTKTIAFLAEDGFELVELGAGEDPDEEGNQEDDSKDEKIELQVLNTQQINFAYLSKNSCYKILQFLWDFNLEIPIPPPELA